MADEWFREAVKPYNEAETWRKEEFWRRCRAELKYDEILTERGVDLLEKEAWYRGHSNGFSEVYGQLCDLVDFVEKISKERKLSKAQEKITDVELEFERCELDISEALSSLQSYICTRLQGKQE